MAAPVYTVANSKGRTIRFRAFSGAPHTLPDDGGIGLPPPIVDYGLWFRCDCHQFHTDIFPTPQDDRIPDDIKKLMDDHAAECKSGNPSNVTEISAFRR